MERGDNLKIIYVISPTFLKSLYKEALHYDFKIQGYGNVTNAIKGLLKTNINDILGFAYVNTRLPQNVEPLKYFMYLCGILTDGCSESKRFLFALQDNDGLEDLFTQDYGNLEFSYLPDIEAFTDLEINRGVFGSILKHNYNPYRNITVGLHKNNRLKNVEDGSLTKADLVKLLDEFPSLEYIYVINPYFLKVFDDCQIFDSLKRTVEEDAVYQDYLEYNKLYSQLRRVFLSLKFLHSSISLHRTLAKTSNKQLTLYKNLIDSLNSGMQSIEDSLQDLDADNYSLVKSIIYILRKQLLQVRDMIYDERW